MLFTGRHLNTGSQLENSPSRENLDVDELLSSPSWSVSALLPSESDTKAKPEISSKQLHHLLRLSALPPPKDATEEAKMLSTLSAQLHFVKEIQKVDTAGVQPLRSLRDETASGEKAAELGLDAFEDALACEEVRGEFHRRIRRRKDAAPVKTEAEWNVFAAASKKTGRYFVVEGGKKA
jgi:Asp-tRNA(Asn)/Glu-tRNA(Gln) amidotransferase C subunit